jgi:phosphoglycerate kinase
LQHFLWYQPFAQKALLLLDLAPELSFRLELYCFPLVLNLFCFPRPDSTAVFRKSQTSAKLKYMNLPKLSDLDVAGKRVLLRLDLDTEPDPNDLRIKASRETLDYLKEKGAEIIIIAHRGRPEGKIDETLSLKPFQPIFDKWGAKLEENLRFDPGEESNNSEFAKKLANMGDVYVNEAFGSSHREHASIVGLSKLLPHAVGFRFEKEVENLSKVFEEPKRPVVFILSGVKEDKLSYLPGIKKFADKVLIGGRLPDFLGDEKLVSVRARGENEKVIVGNLVMDKEDITINTIERFEKEIKKAGTIVVSGPLGKYEEGGHRQGTEKIFKAASISSAFKVAGGGDTEKALKVLNLAEGFDWISVGGGAMLEFLTKRTIAGIEVLLQ